METLLRRWILLGLIMIDNDNRFASLFAKKAVNIIFLVKNSIIVIIIPSQKMYILAL